MSRSVLIVPLSVFFQMKKLARRQQQQQEQQNSQRLGQGTVSQYELHCKLVCLKKTKAQLFNASVSRFVQPY